MDAHTSLRHRRTERRRQELDVDVSRLRQQLSDHHSQLESTRQKAAVFIDNDATPDNESLWQPAASVRDEEVEVAFIREKQRRQSS